MNVNLWGPSFWTVLHGLAVLADQVQDPDFDPKALFAPIRQLLPCGVCREHFSEIYNTMREPLVGTLEAWIYEVHQLINEKQWNSSLQKVQHRLQLTDEERDSLYDARSLLFKSVSFEVHKAKSALHFNDLIPKRDFALVLLCLFGVHDTLIIDGFVRPWLQLIQRFGFSEIVTDLLPRSKEDAYEAILIYKYGANGPKEHAVARLLLT